MSGMPLQVGCFLRFGTKCGIKLQHSARSEHTLFADERNKECEETQDEFSIDAVELNAALWRRLYGAHSDWWNGVPECLFFRICVLVFSVRIQWGISSVGCVCVYLGVGMLFAFTLHIYVQLHVEPRKKLNEFCMFLWKCWLSLIQSRARSTSARENPFTPTVVPARNTQLDESTIQPLPRRHPYNSFLRNIMHVIHIHPWQSIPDSINDNTVFRSFQHFPSRCLFDFSFLPSMCVLLVSVCVCVCVHGIAHQPVTRSPLRVAPSGA